MQCNFETKSCKPWYLAWVETCAGKRRRLRQVTLACDSLEDRVTPAHGGFAHHALSHLANRRASRARHGERLRPRARVRAVVTTTGTATAASPSTTDSDSSTTDSSSSSSSARVDGREDASYRHPDDRACLGHDGRPTDRASRLHSRQLKTDGLTPSSQSALRSFENTLVTDFASGTTLTGNATFLSQFEAIYTSSPTTQETTDLTTAYNALAAAVTSSNITSADITTINTDWAAVAGGRGKHEHGDLPVLPTGDWTTAWPGICWIRARRLAERVSLGGKGGQDPSQKGT